MASRKLTEFELNSCFSENGRGICFQTGYYFCFFWHLELGGVGGFFGGGFVCVCVGLWGFFLLFGWVGVDCCFGQVFLRGCLVSLRMHI